MRSNDVSRLPTNNDPSSGSRPIGSAGFRPNRRFHAVYPSACERTALRYCGCAPAEARRTVPRYHEGAGAMDNDFEKRRSHMHAVTEFAAKTAPAWVEEFKSELSKLPTGTVVAINCVTGEYVTGTGLSEASEAFERRFGKTVGWIHEI